MDGCHACLFCLFGLLTRQFFSACTYCVLCCCYDRRLDGVMLSGKRCILSLCEEDGHCYSWVLYGGKCGICVTYVLFLLHVPLLSHGIGGREI